MNTRYWGYHLLINAAKCKPESIRSSVNIDRFARNLVKKIDMVPYKNPHIVMFGSGNKKGYTLVQLIETSNICAHFVEETNDLYLDVFSCKDFNTAHVRDTVIQYFGHDMTKVDMKFLQRDASEPMR